MNSVSSGGWVSSWLSLVCLATTFTLNGSTAHAQTVVNPRAIRFSASLNHDAIDRNNQPLVSAYRLEIYLTGALQPAMVADLGKPAPDADGYITANLAALVLPGSLYGEILTARAGVVGPGGVSYSNLSNSFRFDTCRYAVNPFDQSVGADGGTFTATVTTPTGCTWQAMSTASWMSIVAGATGIGNGSIVYSVSPNPTTASRTGSVTVANQTITVAEAGQPVPPPSTNALPVVYLTNPLNGVTFRASATITLAATASDADGTIERVDFYANGLPIGSSTTRPFTASWTNAHTGTYVLTAVATDDFGGQTRSDSVEIKVTRRRLR